MKFTNQIQTVDKNLLLVLMYTCNLYLTYYHVCAFIIALQATNQVFNQSSVQKANRRTIVLPFQAAKWKYTTVENQTLLFAKDFIRVSCSLRIVAASHFDRNTYSRH